MLTALEDGVKGECWFSLIDKVYAQRTCWRRLSTGEGQRGGAGVDHQTVEEFERDLMANLKRLAEQLRTGTYRPQAVRRVWIPKPGSGEAPLGIPTVRDRVVQAAVRQSWNRSSNGNSPSTAWLSPRPGLQGRAAPGGRPAEARLHVGGGCGPEELLRHDSARAADGPGAEKVSDGRVLDLLEAFLNSGSWTA